MPITWDPAYFTYLGQAVLRGDPIYSHTFMAYPPLGPLVSAASMVVAGWFDVPSYLAPRYTAVALGIAGVLLVYAVTRRATANPWAGLAAGFVLAGFHLLAASYLATLEPKHLVIFFTLAAAAASQRHLWRLAGCAAALAVTSYQPAILTPLAIGLVAWRSGRRRGDGSGFAFLVGFGVGLLPTLIYIATTGGWLDFWVRTVLLTSAARLPGAGETPFHWLAVLRFWYASEFAFFVAAAIGWLVFAVESLRRGAGGRGGSWFGAQTAAMPLLAAFFCAAAVFEFQGYPDAYPLLPMVAFWTGWLLNRLTQVGVVALKARPSQAGVLRAGLGATGVLLIAWVGFRDVPGQPPSDQLSRQLAEVRRIVGPAEGDVMAFSAEEVYVLSERRSPQPFLRLPNIFVPFLPYAGYRNCADVAARVVAERPRAVALRLRLFQGGCEPVIGQALTAAGYRQERGASELLVYRRHAELETTRDVPESARPTRNAAGPGRWDRMRAQRNDPSLSPEQREAFEQLQSIGYLRGSREDIRRGVATHDEQRAYAGFNFYTSGHAPEAVLMDMDGEVLHRWRLTFDSAYTNLPWVDPSTEWWRRAHLYRNGDVLAIFEGLGLVKIDRDSKLLWASELAAHHDVWVETNGDIYVLTREARMISRISDEEPILEDFISVLDPDGSLKRRVSIVEAFENSQYAAFLGQGKRKTGDITHTNTVQVLDGRIADRIPAFRRGNVLTSMNAMGTIAVIDLDAASVVWAQRGELNGQHDPRLLDSGRLLLFHNREWGDSSRVVEFDPLTKRPAWSYEGTNERPFFSRSCGAAERLPNGNTLITESDGGRAFEVTPSGETVWEFFNPHRAGDSEEFIATLSEVQRIPRDYPGDWLERRGGD